MGRWRPRASTDGSGGGDLVVTGLAKRFGGVTAVAGIDFSVPRGSVLGVIGPNGSGKTTMTNLLTGAYRADRGSARLNGEELIGRPAHQVARLGVARTFQNPHVFQSLTVRQNLNFAVPVRRGAESADGEVGESWLDKMGLSSFIDRVASEMSGGQQKLIEFARAMARRPRLVLMDEPFAGVHPDIKKILRGGIREAQERHGMSFVIVSHEIPDLVKLSDEFICMAGGKILAAGDPAQTCADERVVEAYLGTPAVVA